MGEGRMHARCQNKQSGFRAGKGIRSESTVGGDVKVAGGPLHEFLIQVAAGGRESEVVT